MNRIAPALGCVGVVAFCFLSLAAYVVLNAWVQSVGNPLLSLWWRLAGGG